MRRRRREWKSLLLLLCLSVCPICIPPRVPQSFLIFVQHTQKSMQVNWVDCQVWSVCTLWGLSNHFMYKEFHCSRLLDGLTCQGYTVIMAYNYLIFLNLILNLQDLLKYNQVQLTKSDKVAKTAQIECYTQMQNHKNKSSTSYDSRHRRFCR